MAVTVEVTRVQASYAVIRYVPSILREEFINVGVILVCPELRFQAVQTLPDFNTAQGKLSVFGDADGRFVRHAITKLHHAAEEKRFGELVSTRSAPDGLLTLSGLAELSSTYHNNIRLTEPKMVLTADPTATLDELYTMFVSVQDHKETVASVTREKMQTAVTRAFSEFDLFKTGRVQQKVKPISGSTRVDIMYKNGVMHFYQAIPFVNPDDTARVANNYRMVATDVRGPKSNLGPEYKQAEFAVFGYYAPAQGQAEELEEIKQRLKSENIKLLDYHQDAPKVARRIRDELDADGGTMHLN